ncbi:MAG: hypothetical protein ACJ760_07995 [Thermoleophilaceae bacterium]
MAAAADPTDPSAQNQGAPPDGTSTLVNVVSAIASGLGILGFVVLCGGAITWLRFDKAGLPAEDSVALVPKENLVSYGATALVPAALAALAFVAVLYLADSLVAPLTQWRSSDDSGERDEDDRAAALAKSTATRDRRDADSAAEARETAERYAQELRDEGASAEAIAAAEAKAEVAAAAAYSADRQARATERTAVEAGKKATKGRTRLEDQIRERRLNTRRVLTASLFAVGGLIVVDAASVDLSIGRVLALILVVAAAGAFSLAVLQRTGSFAWLALSAFLSVAVFYGFLNYYKTTQTTKVEPAAVLRKDRGPVTGMFVAQTSDRVYLGTTHANRMFLTSIPRDEVVDLAIGERAELNTAGWQSAQLALDLCADAARAAAKPATTSQDKNKQKSKKKSGATSTPATPPQPPCQPTAVKQLTVQAAH